MDPEVEIYAMAMGHIAHDFGHWASDRGVAIGEDPHELMNEFLTDQAVATLEENHGIRINPDQLGLIASLVEVGGAEALDEFAAENRQP